MSQNGYTSVETTVSKSLPPLFLLYLKKRPPFLIDFENFTPPPTLNTGPPLGINNEQSLREITHHVKQTAKYHVIMSFPPFFTFAVYVVLNLFK